MNSSMSYKSSAHIGNRECSKLIDKSWIKKEVSLLGMKINVDNRKMVEQNYKDKLEKIEKCLNVWKQRDLSLIGRIHIIKSLASSILVYIWSSIINPSETFFKKRIRNTDIQICMEQQSRQDKTNNYDSTI